VRDGGLAHTPDLAHTAGLERDIGLARTVGLACIRPTKKPKGTLSVKAHAKREVNGKSKLPGAYIRRKNQKEKTHWVSKLSSEEI